MILMCRRRGVAEFMRIWIWVCPFGCGASSKKAVIRSRARHNGQEHCIEKHREDRDPILRRVGLVPVIRSGDKYRSSDKI